MPRVIVERQIDCLPTPLFVSLHRVNALADEQEQAFGFRAGGRRCPWRPMCADRVTPCDCLTPSHPELKDVRDASYGRDLGRLEERRVGKEWVLTVCCWWWRVIIKKNKNT